MKAGPDVGKGRKVESGKSRNHRGKNASFADDAPREDEQRKKARKTSVHGPATNKRPPIRNRAGILLISAAAEFRPLRSPVWRQMSRHTVVIRQTRGFGTTTMIVQDMARMQMLSVITRSSSPVFAHADEVPTLLQIQAPYAVIPGCMGAAFFPGALRWVSHAGCGMRENVLSVPRSIIARGPINGQHRPEHVQDRAKKLRKHQLAEQDEDEARCTDCKLQTYMEHLVTAPDRGSAHKRGLSLRRGAHRIPKSSNVYRAGDSKRVRSGEEGETLELRR